MGKKQRLSVAKGDPIAEPKSLIPDVETSKPTRKKGGLKRQRQDSDEAQILEPDVSRKILTSARRQQEELSFESGSEDNDNDNDNKNDKSAKIVSLRDDRNRLDTAGTMEDFSDLEEGDLDTQFELPELSVQEQSIFDKFLSKDELQRRTLAEIIEDKIKDKQTELASQLSDTHLATRQMDPRVVDMYESVGKLLSTYRSGPMPKPFKVIPKMVNWEQILSLTEPENWSAAAMYQATRIFTSNLNAKMCQRYFNLVLLPRIRDDIDEYKKLNFHLYQALMKATFKPAAFFKGIVLPLAESGTCTLREAVIISSIMTKKSVPMLHSAAAMLKLAEMDYSGANSIFLKTLIDKKYTLPYRVIDGLVAHFVKFSMDKRELPVLWHQALLAFCQRYKCDMSSEQRDAILALIKTHSHHQISGEIRREMHEAEKLSSEKVQPMVTD